MTVIKMTLKQFEKKGISLFGENRMLWKFICPVCESIIETKDYQKAKAPGGAVAYSCI
jgi:hypothetical protein